MQRPLTKAPYSGLMRRGTINCNRPTKNLTHLVEDGAQADRSKMTQSKSIGPLRDKSNQHFLPLPKDAIGVEDCLHRLEHLSQQWTSSGERKEGESHLA